MLSFAVAQHVQILQGVQDIVGCHCGRSTDVVDGDLGGFAGVLGGRGGDVCDFVVGEDVHDGFLPVGAVSQEAEVREGFFGRAKFAFAFGELVAEGDEESAEAFTLVLGQSEDAGDVVVVLAFLFLAEVADEMAAFGVAGGHAVEEERVDVVVESFVVEEEFREEAEVAAPSALPAAVDLKERDVVVAVDFVAGRVEESAFRSMSFECARGIGVAEAEFADVHAVGFCVRCWIRREVPWLHLKAAHLDLGQIPYPGDLGLILRHRSACP